MHRVLSTKISSLYVLGIMMFFWSIFDGIMAYTAPIAVSEHVNSKTFMGLIIGSSSMVGALFDLLAFRILPSTYFRRIFLIMFVLCAAYPVVLYHAATVPLFLLAMGVWGIYFDLKNFGNLDFIGRFTEKSKHSSSFGLIQIFQSLGYIVAPIVVGLVIVEGVGWKRFGLALAMLFISSIFFFELIIRKSHELSQPGFDEKHHIRRKQFSELKLWLSIDKSMFPVLMLTFMIFLIDALFWTIGPIFAESFPEQKVFAGLIMAAYTIPSVMVGWVVGSITARYGKKKTAYISLLIGSILLSMMVLAQFNFFVTIGLIFIASMFISISLPTVNGIYADLISEKANYEKEIESLCDFYTNLGYVVGPIGAGIVADLFGNAGAFSAVGVVGIILAIILFKIAPERIRLQ